MEPGRAESGEISIGLTELIARRIDTDPELPGKAAAIVRAALEASNTSAESAGGAASPAIAGVFLNAVRVGASGASVPRPPSTYRPGRA